MFSKEVKERAEAILKNLTLEQKIAQMQCMMSMSDTVTTDMCPDGVGEAMIASLAEKIEDTMDSIDHTIENFRKSEPGIPPMIHTEALTGVSGIGAMVFPSAIGLGATFDPELIEEVGSVIHDQAKAYGYGQVFAPVLDVCRDPRWGRIGETYGEDPTLNAMLGTAFVRSIQGKEGDQLCATGKHFLGYGMSSGGLNMATCTIPERELREVYAKPFQAAITEGGLMSVMNSYGTIDGEMVIGSYHIMTELLRDEMEFDGVLVSDYTSIEHMPDHRVAKDMEDAGLQALKAGLDVEMPLPSGYKTEYLVPAVKEGRLDEALIDRAALRMLETKAACGLFDNPGSDRGRRECFDSEESRNTALKAARKSIVLLKNEGVLPLEKGKKIALIGPHADCVRMLFGGYTMAAGADMVMSGSYADQAGMQSNVEDLTAAFNMSKNAPKYSGSTVERNNPAALAAVAAMYPDTPTILQALSAQDPSAEITSVHGCDYAGQDRSGFEEALAAAQTADVVIMTIGGKYGWGGSCTVGEGIDADDIVDPGVQRELAAKLCETGKPVILLHMNARPFADAMLAEKASGILECWFPGTVGAQAMAEVLYGAYNPAGRLSATAPRSVGQIPVYQGQFIGNSYYTALTPSISARYVDSTPEPLYYFGHGLSYTTFAYSSLKVENPVIPADGTCSITCRVKNTGDAAGEEVVQLYVSDDCASMLRPAQEFAGCKRIFLNPGEEKTVSFTVRADQFAFINKNMDWVVEAGSMTVRIGGSSAALPLTGSFTIENDAKIRPARRGFYAKASVQ